jgi:hypothetical protein
VTDESPKPKVFAPNYNRARKSNIMERKVARRLGGRRLPRSGGMQWSATNKSTLGADISTKTLHIEHKRIEPGTKSLSIKREWLSKVAEGARKHIKHPAFVFHFEGASDYSEDWMMLPLDIAERLLEVLEGYGEDG